MFFGRKCIASIIAAALVTANIVPVSYAQSVQDEQSVEVSVASTAIPSSWTELGSVGAEAIDLPATYVDRNLATGEEILRPYYFINFESLDNGAYPQAIMSYVTKQIFSKDGKKFLVARNGVDDLYEYNTETQQIRLLHDDIQCTTSMDAFVAADQKVYLIGNDRTVYCVDWNGEPPYKKYKIAKLPRSLSGIHITSDGRYINGSVTFSGSQHNTRFDLQNLDSNGYATLDWDYSINFSATNPNSQGIGHNQINPADPDISFFCHEGTTTYIPDRLWIYNNRTKSAYNTFRQSYNYDGTTAECSGHEVWSEDGRYLYFVKYTNNQQKGQNGIVRIPFKDTGSYNENGYPILEDSGEREYINGDYSYWHMFPSGDDKWCVGDINQPTWGNGANYGGVRVALMSTLTYESYPLVTYAPAYNGSHPNQPHARISHGGETVAWQMSLYDKNGSVSPNVGVGYMDITDITSGWSDSSVMRGSFGNHTILKWRNIDNAPSDVSKDGVYQKVSAGKKLFVDINDVQVKNECVPAKATVTYFDRGTNPVRLVYTGGVRDNTYLHMFADKEVLLPKTGTNTQKTVTVDLGYVNLNNITGHGTDIYFTTDNETTYIKSVDIELYDEPDFGIDLTLKNNYYVRAQRNSDFKNGISAYRNNGYTPSYDLFDTTIMSEAELLEAGVDRAVIDYASQNGYRYVAKSSDGSWKYEDVTDSDGVSKTAWFTTSYVRKSSSNVHAVTGSVYFSIETPNINADTNSIDISLTYLDNSTSDINIDYTSTAGLSSAKITRGNTGKWVTQTITLSDSAADMYNTGTKLADQKADFKIRGQSLYISDFSIKVNDDNKITDKTLYVRDISYYNGSSEVNSSKVIDNSVITPKVTVVNNSSEAQKVILFADVYTNSGVRQGFVVSDMTEVPANGSAVVSAKGSLAVGSYCTVRYSVLAQNLKMIDLPVQTDVIDTTAVYSNGDITLSWQSYGTGYTYDVYRNGELLPDGFNYAATEYVDKDVSSGRYVYQVRVRVDTSNALQRKYYYGNYVAVNVG